MKKFNEICKEVEKMDVLTYSSVLAEKSIKILPVLKEITEDDIDAISIDGEISIKEKNWIKQLIY